MAQIIINKENFKSYQCGISDLYTVDSEYNKGEKTSFYYVHFYPTKPQMPTYSCITSKSFTALLGTDAGKKDDVLWKVIKEHQGEFAIEEIIGDDGTPVVFPDSNEKVYSLKKVAHSVAMDDWD